MTPDKRPSQQRPDFDPAALEPILGGPVQIDPVGNGQSNPTWFVTTQGERLVLRKKPRGATLSSAHAIDREYRVLVALQDSGLPLPRPVHYEPDPSLIGTPFYLMERLPGRVSDDTALPHLLPDARRDVHLQAASVLARLHRVDVTAVGLADYGRNSGYYARQVARWRSQWQALEHRTDARIDTLADWFAGNIPPESPTTLVHGDYRIGNLIVADDPARITGVLDWELSTLGDPLADLAHWGMFYDLRPNQMGGLAGLDLSRLGLPDNGAFLETYRAAGGCDAPLRPFHRAFALFRMAIICEGIAARAATGQATSADARAVGALAPDFARLAEARLSTDTLNTA
ncbi:phosphotransferase family protein [Lutimaribacter sp. EGI FJ00015]|nr:phosphotransferase family protein [Lutimaribacter sp. EGI FJ00013]MCO0614543.1 phosphotransferase family protein [Lutimaribacter sp. EGI FJ00015]MCO0637216.1 phosphotransferase family protein [Lutimaribacter sp. EGI FJ00014]